MASILLLLVWGLVSALSIEVGSVDARRLSRASVGTFNTLMGRNSAAFQERKDLLLETLKLADDHHVPDVLCFQELIRKADARAVVEAMTKTHPYHASFDNLFASDSSNFACTPQEIDTTLACVLPKCSHFLALNLTENFPFANCSLVECRDVVFELSPSCFYCLLFEFGAAEDAQADAFTRCASVIPASEYEVSFGLLLMSRYKLKNIETIDFLNGERDAFPRGYIKAKVPAMKQNVLCTHLTPSSSHVDYVGPPQFSGYVEQQTFLVKTLLEVVEDTRRIVIIGGTNNGPASPGNINWAAPLNYGLLTARGLFSANALWCGQCTFCTENILTSPYELKGEGIIIDHVFLPTSRISNLIYVERLFDTVKTLSGVPLSDHYGVRADLWLRRGTTRVCPESSVLGRNGAFLNLTDVESQIDQFCPN